MPKLVKLYNWVCLSLMILLAPAAWADDKAGQNDADTFRMLESFANAFVIIKDNYVEELDESELMTDAINGALGSLDPHSLYVPQQEFEDRQKQAYREYGGLGIEVILENDLVKMTYVLPDGPAAKAGLKKDEYITAVEGKSVRGKTLNEAVEGMRGLAGEPVNVTVLSETNMLRDVEVTRAVVQGRVVRHSVRDDVGYIRIGSFNHPRLARDVADAIADLKRNFDGTLPGLVIDLRENPGGRVDQTVAVASHFLDGGEVFSARGRSVEDTQRFNAKAGELVPGTPIAVIINSRSASAAEILAGAIQDRDRGFVVGRRSFGKGSVQTILQTDSAGGKIRLTTQLYYTPSGQSIQGYGITPDYLVAYNSSDKDSGSWFREDSFKNSIENPKQNAHEASEKTLDYPPDDWPSDQDYQISKTIELLKTHSKNNIVSSQDK